MATALVVGSRGFGKHYARILAEVAAEFDIERIILTRTDPSVVAELNAKADGTLFHHAVVRNQAELCAVLEEYQPTFTGITAKDPVMGDDIHPGYVAKALRNGAVLCEKPFSNATGDGSSPRKVVVPDNHPFGLELPFAVVQERMRTHEGVYDRLLGAEHITYVWNTNGSGNDIIDNLALHPWSLIPSEFSLQAIHVHQESPTQTRLYAEYTHNGRPVGVDIVLAYVDPSKRFLGFEIDSKGFMIEIDGVKNTLQETSGSLQDVWAGSVTRHALFTVENPLRQHIVACLRGQPLVGVRRTFESQLFLEQAHGYRA